MKKEKQARKNGKRSSPETQPQTAENPVKRAAQKSALPIQWETHGLSLLEHEVNEVVALLELLTTKVADYQEDCDPKKRRNAAVGTLQLSDVILTNFRAALDAARAYYKGLPDRLQTGTLPVGWRTHGLSDMEYEINYMVGLVELLASKVADYQKYYAGSENCHHAAVGTRELSDRILDNLYDGFYAAWAYYKALSDQPRASAVSAEAGKGGAQ